MPTLEEVVEQCAGIHINGRGTVNHRSIIDKMFRAATTPAQEAAVCQKIITALKQQPGNDVCADCHAPRPEYSSINLGVFLCSWCFGVHREMGTHVSRTKSIRLDTWRKEWMSTLVRVGNGRSKKVWEGRKTDADAERPSLEATSNEAQLSSRRPFVKNKYERFKYYLPCTPTSQAEGIPSSVPSVKVPPAVTTVQKPEIEPLIDLASLTSLSVSAKVYPSQPQSGVGTTITLNCQGNPLNSHAAVQAHATFDPFGQSYSALQPFTTKPQLDRIGGVPHTTNVDTKIGKHVLAEFDPLA